MGILWEEENIGVFLILTVILGGGAAYLTGRAMALTWRPAWMGMAYMTILGCAVRFFRYALFEGSFFFYLTNDGYLYPGIGFYYYLVDLVVLMGFAWLGYRVTRSGQMATQYAWIYARSGPLFWRPRASLTGRQDQA